MEVVKKLCTVMLVFCLSLAVFVGPAEASRCALVPPDVYFPELECQQSGDICRQNFISVDGRDLSNVYVTFNSRERDSQGISFLIIGEDLPENELAPGTSTVKKPVTIPKVFSTDRREGFKQFQVQARNPYGPPFDIHASVEGYCID